MRINYEDAAWLWLDSKDWAITPQLLFASKQLILQEADNLKKLRVSQFVHELDSVSAIDQTHGRSL